MIEDKKVLGLIVARGGSKGFPKKNLARVAGSPIMEYTVREAQQSEYLDRLVISTECADILRLAVELGCEAPFVRPSNLATDKTSTVEVAIHAISELSDFEILTILQPTSPLRLAADIDKTIEALVYNNASSAVTVTEVVDHPYLTFSKNSRGALNAIVDTTGLSLRRQDLPLTYKLNGAVYSIRIADLLIQKALILDDTQGVVIPRSRSLDIDTQDDLIEVERALAAAL